jgi:hypothetical protein
MLAGAARIVEICYFMPTYIPLPAEAIAGHDGSSEHTLADIPVKEEVVIAKAAAGRAFRHLPPFVSAILVSNYRLVLMIDATIVASCRRRTFVHVGYRRGARVCP